MDDSYRQCNDCIGRSLCDIAKPSDPCEAKKIVEQEKHADVRLVLDFVLGDYFPTLVSDFNGDDEDLDVFVDGLYEIGKAFDINIHDFDVDNLLVKGWNK